MKLFFTDHAKRRMAERFPCVDVQDVREAVLGVAVPAKTFYLCMGRIRMVCAKQSSRIASVITVDFNKTGHMMTRAIPESETSRAWAQAWSGRITSHRPRLGRHMIQKETPNDH